ncbi:MAG: ABC transporter ATP-binding protein [Pseudomonadota bacterium]
MVGETGSVKSVTSLATMRLIPQPPGRIVSGRIDFEGRDLLTLPERDMRALRGNDVSMIFQEPMTSLNPVYTVGNQIVEVLRMHRKLSRAEARERAVDLLDQVGIPSPATRVRAYPHELSGGQKQRVMIAMAIACEPKLLIADEPTTALDVTIQKQVLELMFELQQRLDMSLLFITHDLGVIADIADEVVVMYRSRIVERGTTRQIFEHPENPYTKGLLACRPALGNNPRRLLTVSDFLTEDGAERAVPAERRQPARKAPPGADDVLLSVAGLKTHFKPRTVWLGRTPDTVRAVDDVTFDIRRGETLGLVGESGCGKTTLGRTLLRLIEPTAGTITFDGIDLGAQRGEALRALRRRMQIVFQDPYSSLNPRMTIGDVLTEPLKIHGIAASKAERLKRAAEMLERVDLSPSQLKRYPHEFSGGQRQRICIARALMLKPEFIVCDESVSALDVSVQAQVLNLLLDLQDDLHITYLFISHDLSVVDFIADRVGVMNAGKIVELDTAERIYRQPSQDYTRRLLDAIPKGIPKDTPAR